MIGSDMVVVHEDADGEWVATDSHSPTKSKPVADDNQDWTLHNRTVADGVTTVLLSRILEPCDPQDRPIVDNDQDTRIVVAHGTAGPLSYHSTTRTSDRVNFFKVTPDPLEAIKASDDFKVMHLKARSYADLAIGFELPVPGNVDTATTYVDFCVQVPEDGQLVAFEALLDPAAAQYVHHFVVQGYKRELKASCTDEVYATVCKPDYPTKMTAWHTACTREADGSYGATCSQEPACLTALQDLTRDDGVCMGVQEGGTSSVRDYLDFFLNEIALPCGADFGIGAFAILRDCQAELKEFDDMWVLCAEQSQGRDCAKCLPAVEAISWETWSGCVTELIFGGNVEGGLEWIRNQMHRSCGGSGDWEPISSMLAMDDLWGWGPGSSPMILPANVGFDIGSKGYKTLGINVHYDNPQSTPNVVDTSGIAAYYTTTARENSAGMLQLGDKFVIMETLPVAEANATGELAEHVFTCPGEATQLALGNESITIISSLLHMHVDGYFMETVVLDSTGAEKQRATAEYYDGNFQTDVHAQFEITGGDTLRTRCVYKPKEGAMFGLGKSAEMCIDFLIYYPVNEKLSNDFRGACGVELHNHPLVQQLAADGFKIHSQTSLGLQSLTRRFSQQPTAECVAASSTTTMTPTTTATTTVAEDASGTAGICASAAVLLVLGKF